MPVPTPPQPGTRGPRRHHIWSLEVWSLSIGLGKTVERSTGRRWEPNLSVSYSPECVEGRFSELRPEGF